MPNITNLQHIITSEQFTKEYLEELFIIADKIKENKGKYSKSLEGKVMAILFYEPSTRTRSSFDVAVKRLGGQTTTTENASEFSSAVKGETMEDTIRVMQGYCDGIIIRHKDEDWAEKAVKVAKVPIINAGSGKKEHPTQSLLDMYTIREFKGRLNNLKVMIGGDLQYGRTTHSLIKLLSLYENNQIYGLSRPEFQLPQEYIDFMKERGVSYTACENFDELPQDLDVLYHTRTQLERLPKEQQGKNIQEFIINKEVLNKFPNAILMHPLPRVNEITTDVDEDSRSVFFKQAENGLWARMALLTKIFGE